MQPRIFLIMTLLVMVAAGLLIPRAQRFKLPDIPLPKPPSIALLQPFRLAVDPPERIAAVNAALLEAGAATTLQTYKRMSEHGATLPFSGPEPHATPPLNHYYFIDLGPEPDLYRDSTSPDNFQRFSTASKENPFASAKLDATVYPLEIDGIIRGATYLQFDANGRGSLQGISCPIYEVNDGVGLFFQVLPELAADPRVRAGSFEPRMLTLADPRSFESLEVIWLKAKTDAADLFYIPGEDSKFPGTKTTKTERFRNGREMMAMFGKFTKLHAPPKGLGNIEVR